MMVWECTSTCYILFWTVVVLASDPKDLFVKCVTIFTTTITMLIWVARVACCFSNFVVI
jgi:hypothetical protein